MKSYFECFQHGQVPVQIVVACPPTRPKMFLFFVQTFTSRIIFVFIKWLKYWQRVSTIWNDTSNAFNMSGYDKKLYIIKYYVSYVICLISPVECYVKCHLSNFTCQISAITSYISSITCKLFQLSLCPKNVRRRVQKQLTINRIPFPNDIIFSKENFTIYLT